MAERRIPLAARRVFRLAFTVALTTAAAYALALDLPYIAPIFALILTLAPSPPMGPKQLLGLIVVVFLTTGIGLLVHPVLVHYPTTGILIIALGLFFSTYISINLQKAAAGSLLIIGFTLIPAAGTVDFQLALTVIESLLVGITLAIICQWLVYPWFPEDGGLPPPPVETAAPPPSAWLALRTTLIVLPPVFIALTNPAMYLAIIMKAVALGQQGTALNARNAGVELLGSTAVAGCCAVLLWFGLQLAPNLWMYFWWIALFVTGVGCCIYGVVKTRFTASFWQNVGVTLFILLGPAVQDSAMGKDVYKAFALRISMFFFVALYAWAAVFLLEYLRTRRQIRSMRQAGTPEFVI